MNGEVKPDHQGLGNILFEIGGIEHGQPEETDPECMRSRWYFRDCPEQDKLDRFSCTVNQCRGQCDAFVLLANIGAQ